MSSKRPVDDAPGGLSHNPFAKLRAGDARDSAGSNTPGSDAADSPQRPSPALDLRGARVIVRREKKGRGGKTMTRIEGTGLPAAGLDALAVRLKRALGCGAVVESEDVLIQGAQTDRAAAWLREHSAADVRIGN